MLEKPNIVVLSTFASFGTALAFLGAVSALWGYAPNEDGLRNFAFTLATVFAMVLGNLTLLGVHFLQSNNPPRRFAPRVSRYLSVIVFVTGLFTASVLFSEGLNSWFDVPPTLPDALVWYVRLVILVPLAWLAYTSIVPRFANAIRPRTKNSK